VGKKETSFFSIRAIIQKMRKSLLSFTKCQSHCYHSQNAKVIAIIQKMPKSLLSFKKCQSHCYRSQNSKVIAIRSQNAKVIAIIQKMPKSLPFVHKMPKSLLSFKKCQSRQLGPALHQSRQIGAAGNDDEFFVFIHYLLIYQL
jgi:hypothetical protein